MGEIGLGAIVGGGFRRFYIRRRMATIGKTWAKSWSTSSWSSDSGECGGDRGWPRALRLD